MKLLFLYLSFAFVGYYIGSRFKGAKLPWQMFSKFTIAAVFVLVFIMGSRIGGDPRVLASLGTIGLTAFYITIASFIGSILFVYLARKVIGINREGKKI